MITKLDIVSKTVPQIYIIYSSDTSSKLLETNGSLKKIDTSDTFPKLVEIQRKLSLSTLSICPIWILAVKPFGIAGSDVFSSLPKSTRGTKTT